MPPVLYPVCAYKVFPSPFQYIWMFLFAPEPNNWSFFWVEQTVIGSNPLEQTKKARLIFQMGGSNRIFWT